jgi:hypothetical protein
MDAEDLWFFQLHCHSLDDLPAVIGEIRATSDSLAARSSAFFRDPDLRIPATLEQDCARLCSDCQSHQENFRTKYSELASLKTRAQNPIFNAYIQLSNLRQAKTYLEQVKLLDDQRGVVPQTRPFPPDFLRAAALCETQTRPGSLLHTAIAKFHQHLDHAFFNTAPNFESKFDMSWITTFGAILDLPSHAHRRDNFFGLIFATFGEYLQEAEAAAINSGLWISEILRKWGTTYGAVDRESGEKIAKDAKCGETEPLKHSRNVHQLFLSNLVIFYQRTTKERFTRLVAERSKLFQGSKAIRFFDLRFGSHAWGRFDWCDDLLLQTVDRVASELLSGRVQFGAVWQLFVLWFRFGEEAQIFQHEALQFACRAPAFKRLSAGVFQREFDRLVKAARDAPPEREWSARITELIQFCTTYRRVCEALELSLAAGPAVRAGIRRAVRQCAWIAWVQGTSPPSLLEILTATADAIGPNCSQFVLTFVQEVTVHWMREIPAMARGKGAEFMEAALRCVHAMNEQLEPYHPKHDFRHLIVFLQESRAPKRIARPDDLQDDLAQPMQTLNTWLELCNEGAKTAEQLLEDARHAIQPDK